MRKGQNPWKVESELSPDVQSFWQLSRSYAAGVSWSLDESWKRPVRHNRKLERLALWYTVSLDKNLEYALDAGSRVFPLSVAFDPDARYEITAAVHEIPRLVPFAAERSNLRQPIGSHFDAWGEEISDREPQLVGRWHEWVWETSGTAADTQDHGDASVLAVACTRLAEVLPKALGWDVDR
jgi:hypothetical protein